MDGTNGVIAVFNSDGTKAADQKFTKQGNEIKAEFKVGSDWSDVVYGNISCLIIRNRTDNRTP